MPGKLYLAESVNVVWGEWSIVRATLNCINLIKKYDLDSDYFALLSGSCMPVKPIKLLEKYLLTKGKDYIEAVDAEKFRWITAGIQKERWQQYHFFNWRYQRSLFDFSLKVQNKIGVKRTLPLGHRAHMGSQWWCLRRSTIISIASMVDDHKELESFYKKTWVPDELFFQTLVANTVPASEISDELITRYRFNELGVPKVYYDDALSKLLAEDKFFVRKVSHSAGSLRGELSKIAAMSVEEYEGYIKVEGQRHLDNIKSDLMLRNSCLDNQWHSLIHQQENKYDFVKSIPNEMVVVVGGDDFERQSVLHALDAFDETVVYADLFGGREVFSEFERQNFIGLSQDAVRLAQHTWHQVLGNVSHFYQGKTIAFSLGSNAQRFLEVLKWKSNVNVFLLDESACREFADVDSHNLRVVSQSYHQLHQRYCQLLVGSADFFSSVLNQWSNNNHSWQFSLQSLNKKAVARSLPSLSIVGCREPNSGVESAIPVNGNIILISDNEDAAKSCHDMLVDELGFSGLWRPFPVTLKRYSTFDAHFYLLQLVQIQKRCYSGNGIVVSMGFGDVPKLEFLKHDQETIIIHLVEDDNAVDKLQLTPMGMGSQLEQLDELQADKELLATYMRDREGPYLVYRSDELKRLKRDVCASLGVKSTVDASHG